MSTATAVTVGTWKLDPSHSEIGFTVRHLVSKVRGKFETFEATFVTSEDLTATKASVSVDLSSINTGTPDRDAHLRSADFFSVEEHPTMTYVTTGIVARDDEFVVTGDLTIKGVTKPVTLDVEVGGFGPDAYGGTRAGFTATTTINRNDFGVDISMPLDGGGVVVGEKVQISLEIEAVLRNA